MKYYFKIIVFALLTINHGSGVLYSKILYGFNIFIYLLLIIAAYQYNSYFPNFFI